MNHHHSDDSSSNYQACSSNFNAKYFHVILLT
jgi:hypothetical protein